MNRLFKMFIFIALGVMSVSMVGVASAEIVSTPQDEGIVIIIIAVTTGSVIAPLYGWATQKPDKDGKTQSFDPKQYGRALIVVFIGNMALIMTQIELLSIEVITLQAIVMIFIAAFIQAIGINAVKAGASHSLNPKTS